MSDNRFVTRTLLELEAVNQSPISGYEEFPILTLEETVEKLAPLLNDVKDHIARAKKQCNQESIFLTKDESAAIYLYSMQTSFFSSLNKTLRAENRDEIKPWFAFLKLFITALKKLPSTKATVWRGVNYDDTLTFVDDDVHIWWSVNSCSLNIEIVQPYLGNSGTLFAIDANAAKDISTFSAFPDEQEIILMPGTHVRRRYGSFSFIDRLFILHLEEINPRSKSELEANHLIEHIKQIYQRESRIRRIMNPAKSFPIQQNYINLSIVKSKEQQEKEKQLCETQYSHNIMNSFEEIYGAKSPVEIKNIFEICQQEQKQLLVFGRAGIGKSTFCRYVAYRWAIGSLWSQYDLLVLISLRNLTINNYPTLPFGQTYSLTDLIKKELFQDDLSENDEKLLKMQLRSNKTLWILDGYDEIVGNIPAHLELLFKKLLDTSHHIVTSRPYLNTLSYDVQMEITGFMDENIEQYVQLFFYQMKDELDDASIRCQILLSFLRQNRSIWGVAHIPINLELICSVWSNEDFFEGKVLTITTLYTTITKRICRRHLTSQNKSILELTDNEIEQRCNKELAFLEKLAFDAMKDNTIIIRPALLKRAIDEVKISSNEHPHILNLGILKSFDKPGTGDCIQTNKDHYFVHLSFQEYFAARYLIHALSGSTLQEPIEFIKYQKYNQRYTLVFTFTVELLAEYNDEKNLTLFWNTILEEPLDLVGIRHLQLVIYCLDETSNKSTFSRREKLLQSIAACTDYTLRTRNLYIRDHLLEALRKAQNVTTHDTIMKAFNDLLQEGNKNIIIDVLSFISKLTLLNPTSPLLTSIVTILDDKDVTLRRYACRALERMGEKIATIEVIRKLISALEDEDQYVKSYTCDALGKIGKVAATGEVISKLVNALGDDNEYVRRNAFKALQKLIENVETNKVISSLLMALSDNNKMVVMNVCEILSKLGEKAATNEAISELLNVLGDENDYVRRSASDALVSMTKKVLKNELISNLLSALEDDDRYVRLGASETLREMTSNITVNENMIANLITALYEIRIGWSAQMYVKLSQKWAKKE